jgi:hypothetical protein
MVGHVEIVVGILVRTAQILNLIQIIVLMIIILFGKSKEKYVLFVSQIKNASNVRNAPSIFA